MECKFSSSSRRTFGVQELIDTLWNVNYGTLSWCVGTGRELIDTLWNVNPVPLFAYKKVCLN